MSDAMELLLERLQTGWQPTPDEISPEVPQRTFSTWLCVPKTLSGFIE
jgi:hypothetical protein